MEHFVELNLLRFVNSFWRVSEAFLEWEPIDVDGEADADEVVQLKEETEGSFFKLVHYRKHFDELIHSRKTEVDE